MKRQLEKPQEAFEKSLYISFKFGSNKIFSIAKHVRSLVMYSTSVVIVTINGGTDHATNF